MTTAPKCGHVSFFVEVTDEHVTGRDYEIYAQMFNVPVGEMVLELRDHPDLGRVLTVNSAKVHTPRCGVGTKLYRRALQLACANNAKLASDVERTEASEGFWRKQESKRRALCYLSDERGIRIKYGADGIFRNTGTHWPCRRFVLREACPRQMDLSGRRRR